MARKYKPVVDFEFLKEDDKFVYFHLIFPKSPKTYLQVGDYLKSLIKMYFSVAEKILGVEEIFEWLSENKKSVNAIAFYWNEKTRDEFLKQIPKKWQKHYQFFIFGFFPEIDNELENFVLKVNKGELIKERREDESC